MPRQRLATPDEIAERIELVAQLLARNQPVSVIKAAVRTRFGVPDLSARQIQSYIQRAQRMMLESVGKTTEQHAAESYHAYGELIRRFPDNPHIVLRALESRDRMMGTHGNTIRAKADSAEAERAASRDRDPRELLDALNRVIRQLEADAGDRPAAGVGEETMSEQPEPA